MTLVASRQHQESFTFVDLVRKGNVCFEGEDFEQAVAYYDRALQLQPNAQVVQLNARAVQLARTFALLAMGKKDEVDDRKGRRMFTFIHFRLAHPPSELAELHYLADYVIGVKQVLPGNTASHSQIFLIANDKSAWLWDGTKPLYYARLSYMLDPEGVRKVS